MKTAIYQNDGMLQVVLTPETEFEKAALKLVTDKPTSVHVMEGQFYECRGGWIRENTTETSLIIRVDEAHAPTEPGNLHGSQGE